MRSIGLIILLCFSQNIIATAARPFLTQNQNPLLLVYGVPAASPAYIPEQGRWHSDWSLNLTNTLNIENPGTAGLIIDGEIYQLNLQTEYSPSKNLALGIKLSWIEHSAGFLDRSIERYHDLFGLPQGKRLSFARNQIQYSYEQNEEQQFHVQTSTGGIGDILLTAAHKLAQSTTRDYSLRASLKLPVGDAEQFTGSEAADFALWLAGRETLGEKWQSFGTLGLLWLGRGKILADLQNDQVVFGNLGLEWQYWENLALKMQLEWNTAFHKDTDVRMMGDAIQLSFGTSWYINAKTQFDFAITEDIKEEASPDVTFHFAIRFRH